MPIRETASLRKTPRRTANKLSKISRKRSRFGSERGSASAKTLIWVAIMLALIFAAIKVVPVLITEYQFQDFMQSTARFASVNRMTTAADISKSVMEEAQKQAIPLKAEDVHVTAQGGDINISADYTVTVDLNVYQFTLNFHPSAGNKPLT